MNSVESQAGVCRSISVRSASENRTVEATRSLTRSRWCLTSPGPTVRATRVNVGSPIATISSRWSVASRMWNLLGPGRRVWRKCVGPSSET